MYWWRQRTGPELNGSYRPSRPRTDKRMGPSTHSMFVAKYSPLCVPRYDLFRQNLSSPGPPVSISSRPNSSFSYRTAASHRVYDNDPDSFLSRPPCLTFGISLRYFWLLNKTYTRSVVLKWFFKLLFFFFVFNFGSGSNNSNYELSGSRSLSSTSSSDFNKYIRHIICLRCLKQWRSDKDICIL